MAVNFTQIAAESELKLDSLTSPRIPLKINAFSEPYGYLTSFCAAQVLAKTARNAMIGFVVLAYAIYWAAQGQAEKVTNKAAFLWKKFPKFILGFLLMSLLVGFHAFDKGQVSSLGNLSKWAFLLTFAGVGLRTNFREMSKQGLRPFIVGALGEILIACLTLGLVVGANRIWGL
jgi:uncharacterized membrane protein YadS